MSVCKICSQIKENIKTDIFCKGYKMCTNCREEIYPFCLEKLPTLDICNICFETCKELNNINCCKNKKWCMDCEKR